MWTRVSQFFSRILRTPLSRRVHLGGHWSVADNLKPQFAMQSFPPCQKSVDAFVAAPGGLGLIGQVWAFRSGCTCTGKDEEAAIDLEGGILGPEQGVDLPSR